MRASFFFYSEVALSSTCQRQIRSNTPCRGDSIWRSFSCCFRWPDAESRPC